MNIRICLGALLALGPALVRADHQSFVIINVTASKAYTQQKMADGSPRPETYLFYQGNFFPGTPDPSIERMSFDEIVHTLAPGLARQNYRPTKDLTGADLLIVVNWGTTMTEPGAEKTDTEKLLQFDKLMTSVGSYNSAWSAYMSGGGAPMPDPSGITANLSVQQGLENSAESYASRNARLLGYTDTLNREERKSWAFQDGLNTAAETHLVELTQERYFVILLAYDYQKLIHGRGPAADAGSRRPAAPPQPVWSLRMNIQADGNNFRLALPAMAEVASDYFGKQYDDLQTAQVSVGSKGNVQIGETRILGENK